MILAAAKELDLKSLLSPALTAEKWIREGASIVSSGKIVECDGFKTKLAF